MLYITIPTYNRAAALKKTLEIILPQLHENARCVVLDNCSTDATPDVVAQAQRQSPYVRTVRHPVNIGGSANFLRCFEVAPEGWIWLLSDDDAPHHDAVATIEAEISRHPDACYINFATIRRPPAKPLHRPSTTVSIGIDGLVEALDHFGNLLFITAGVHNLEHNRPSLRLAALEIASHAVHVAVTLNTLALNPSLRTVQSSGIIADLDGPASWSPDAVTTGLLRLLPLIPNLGTRRLFANKMFEMFPPGTPQGTYRHLLSGMRTSDAMLSNAIERYGFLAATIHRYRVPTMVAILCQAVAPYGPRVALQSIHSLVRGRRSGTQPSQPEKKPHQSVIEQLRTSDRS